MVRTDTCRCRAGLASLVAVLALVCLFPASARAQVDFEIVAGPTIADFTGSYIDSSISTWGIVGGAVINWRLHRHWALEGGLNFTQMGAFEVKLADQEDKFDYRLAYLAFPVTVQFLVPLWEDRWLLNLGAGAAFASRSACEVKEAGFPEFQLDCEERTPGGEVAKTDVLPQFAIGIDRVFDGGSGFGFDVRYSLGTQNLFQDGKDQGLSSKHAVLDIKFHFFLPLGGPR